MNLLDAIYVVLLMLVTSYPAVADTSIPKANLPQAPADTPSDDNDNDPTKHLPGASEVLRIAAKTDAARNPIDALRAFSYLEQLCDIGPRISGTPGMVKQQELLQRHFEKHGAKVTMQRFQARNPQGGDPVPMANLVAQFHPDRQQRILLAAHYDTRPLPDRDPNPVRRREGVFLSANDGTSGVAILMELAHLLPELEGPYGIDIVLFDGEELVYVDNRDPYFLGSTWFAREYVAHPPDHQYRWGVLLDMVGDADLRIHQEKFSATWRDTRPLVKAIWNTAARLEVDEFVPRVGYEVLDDHLPLHNTAKIPTCNIIDFDYPAWHTEADTPRRCSPTSLGKVGWVVYEWLKEEQQREIAVGPGENRE